MDLFSVDGLSSSMRSEECFGGEKRGERKKIHFTARNDSEVFCSFLHQFSVIKSCGVSDLLFEWHVMEISPLVLLSSTAFLCCDHVARFGFFAASLGEGLGVEVLATKVPFEGE